MFELLFEPLLLTGEPTGLAWLELAPGLAELSGDGTVVWEVEFPPAPTAPGLFVVGGPPVPGLDLMVGVVELLLLDDVLLLLLEFVT